jgi:hypothetical protein
VRRSLASGQLRQLAPVRFLPGMAPAEEENAETQKDEGGAGDAQPKKEQGERNAPHGLQRDEQVLALESGPIETGGARPRVSMGLLPARSTAHERGVGGGHGATSFSRGATGSGRTGVGVRAAESGPTGDVRVVIRVCAVRAVMDTCRRPGSDARATAVTVIWRT